MASRAMSNGSSVGVKSNIQREDLERIPVSSHIKGEESGARRDIPFPNYTSATGLSADNAMTSNS